MRIELNGESVFVGQGGATWREGQSILLLLHGAGMDHTVWVLLARYAARHGFNLVVPDLPAHGGSSGNALDTIDAQGRWLSQLLEVLHRSQGLKPASLVLAGHSMGALAVLAAARSMLAEESSDRSFDFLSLVLFGVGYPMQVSDALLEAARTDLPGAADMITTFGHGFHSILGHNPIAGISVSQSARVLLERSRPGVLATDLQACHQFRLSDEDIDLLSQHPITIIAGSEDRMTPKRSSTELARQLQARQVMVPACGHMIMAEQPESALQELLRALENIEPGPLGESDASRNAH